MKARIPLYVRILGWFFLNVGLIGTGLYLAFGSGRAGEWLVMQQAEPRLQSLSRLLLRELQPLPVDRWDAVLEKYSESHDMRVTVFGGDGTQLAGEPLTLPDKVRRRLNERAQPGNPAGPGPVRQPQPDRGRAPDFAEPFRPNAAPAGAGGPPAGGAEQPPFGRPRRGEAGAPNPPGYFGPWNPEPGNPPVALRQDQNFAKVVERTDDPDAWWFIIRVPLRPQPWIGGASLVLMTRSLTAGGLLVDLTPWLWGAAGLMVVSALLWIPLVSGITRHISRMKKATDRIAAGEFDVAIPDRRRDELGELAGGINRMARRLSGFVSGQKRFLGDIAHELCTPLARMQMGSAALEQRAPAELRERVADLTEEVEAMSRLVGELLDFSRAGLAPQSVALTRVSLEPMLVRLAEREGLPAEQLRVSVAPDSAVLANEGLLARALANVMRNAARYAGPRPEVTAAAVREGGRVILTVADNGPGVPAESLARLFDPFFRPESDRARETGGAGLGLAIVRTCIESCQGTVTAANGDGGGLVIRFELPAA